MDFMYTFSRINPPRPEIMIAKRKKYIVRAGTYRTRNLIQTNSSLLAGKPFFFFCFLQVNSVNRYAQYRYFDLFFFSRFPLEVHLYLLLCNLVINKKKKQHVFNICFRYYGLLSACRGPNGTTETRF